MDLYRNKTTTLCSALLAIVIWGCSGSGSESGPDNENRVVEVRLTAPVTTLLVGFGSERLPLSATALNSNGQAIQGKSFAWSSDNTGIASVDPSGLVRPLGFGSVVISAEVDGVMDRLEISLEQESKEPFSAQETISFVNVSLISMEQNGVAANRTVVVENGVISEIGPAETLMARGTIIEGNGGYLMPGLADMHTHVGANVTESGMGRNAALWSLTSKGQLLSYLANGVTTILNNGDFGEPINQWGQDVMARTYPGPTIYAAKWARGPQDGVGNGHDLVDVADAAQHVYTSKAEGYDFIKVYNQTPPFAIPAFVEHATYAGMGVFGHLPQTQSATRTLNQEMSMVAHSAAYFWTHFGFSTNEDLITSALEVTLENGTYLTTTLAIEKTIAKIWCGNQEAWQALLARPSLRYVHHPTSLRIWLNGFNGSRWNPQGCSIGGFDARNAFQEKYTKIFYEAGIPFLLGTDSPTVLGAAGFSIHLELEELQEMGIDNYNILKMGTVHAGRYINTHIYRSLPFGTVVEGARADLILLKENPLEDLAALKARVGVMARGHWYTEAFLQEALEDLAQEYGN